MSKNTKIFLGFLAFLLIIFLAFRNTKTGVEKSLIKNKIAKATREPILGKEPVNEFMAKVTEAEIPFVQNKQIQHKYDENKTKSSDSLVVKWEEVKDPKIEDIRELNEEYADFIEDKSDARYFKADFTELFKKKVGDEVTLVIDGEEFNGVIVNADIEKPDGIYYSDGSTKQIYYNYRIQPNKSDYSNYIDIGGSLNPLTGEINYEGDIDYTGINGGIKYRYDINNKIGVIIPYDDFDNYINFKNPVDCVNHDCTYN